MGKGKHEQVNTKCEILKAVLGKVYKQKQGIVQYMDAYLKT